VQRLDDVEARAVAKPQVDHREIRRIAPHLGDALCHCFGSSDVEAAAFHRPCQPCHEGLVVIDQK
jgi:hypothetical protein